MTAIFLIRHAEKPDLQTQGVNEQGVNSPASLTARGWQRAGALAVFFVGKHGLPAPDRIYASAAHKPCSRSARPLETVIPLAARLNMAVLDQYTRGDEADLAHELIQQPGTTLVCWQREAIPQIAKLIAGAGVPIPELWPLDRFDVVWTLTQAEAGGAWTFGQVCQQLLAGDRSDPLA